MDWSPYFPRFVEQPPPPSDETAAAREDGAVPGTAAATAGRLGKGVEIVDIGCGFGGLLVALAPLRPDTLMLGRCLGARCSADLSRLSTD